MNSKLSEEKKLVISYCSTFLPREMKHVYRQINAISRFNHHVVSRTVRNQDIFPYAPIHQLKKAPFRILQRLFSSTNKGTISPLSRYELTQIKQIINDLHPSLIHLYLGTEAARLLPLLPDVKSNIIVSFHGADVSLDLPDDELDQLVQYSRYFLCRSRSLQRALIGRGVPEQMILIHRTGVPIPAQTTDISHQKPLNNEAIIKLLQVCRFVPKKGIETTLEALKRLRENGVNAELTLAGDGPLYKALERKSADLGIADQVHFLGFLSQQQLSNCYRSHDFFVHPSLQTASGDREGIPNSLLEAMAYGMPVIATEHSGIPEVISHRSNGWLMGAADPNCLSEAVQTLLASDVLREGIMKNAAATVARDYSIKASARALEDIYYKAINEDPL